MIIGVIVCNAFWLLLELIRPQHHLFLCSVHPFSGSIYQKAVVLLKLLKSTRTSIIGLLIIKMDGWMHLSANTRAIINVLNNMFSLINHTGMNILHIYNISWILQERSTLTHIWRLVRIHFEPT